MTPASSGAGTEDGHRGYYVEVVQNRHRFEHHVVPVLQHRQAAPRIQRNIWRRLVFLLVEMQQLRLVRQTLVLERQQHPPRERAAAPPVKSKCHGGDCSGCACGGMALSWIMDFTTTIDVAALRALIGVPSIVRLDCRFDLAAPDAGRQAYLARHIPSARYIDLNRDLSAPVSPMSGRHPLPEPARLAARLGDMGVGPGTQVIAYDEATAPSRPAPGGCCAGWGLPRPRCWTAASGPGWQRAAPSVRRTAAGAESPAGRRTGSQRSRGCACGAQHRRTRRRARRSPESIGGCARARAF